MCTGWTWDYVGECMDLPRIRAMQLYWAKWPPLYQLMARRFGVGPVEKVVKKTGIEDLAARFGSIGMKVSKGNVPKPPSIH